jgi:hypothetical protein
MGEFFCSIKLYPEGSRESKRANEKLYGGIYEDWMLTA